MAIQGSCLCGSVKYELDAEPDMVGHCHCSKCRKAHGAAFGTHGLIARKDFRWTAGEEKLNAFESSPGSFRKFCGLCGSQILFDSDALPDSFAFAFATLDDDPAARPAMHIFVGSKAPWYEITDQLPQAKEMPAE